jgi:hypothetical protein
MTEPLKPQKPTISANRKLVELTVDEMSRVAMAFQKSQTFKANREPMTAAEIFVIILAGQELGLGPSQAMMGIKMIEGKPEMSANTMAAMVKAGGKYDYRVEWGADEDKWCEIAFFDVATGESVGVSRFTEQMAQDAGLGKPSRSGQPSNYTKYWRSMFFARALSNGVKWFTPDALRVSAYHEGEIDGDTAAPVPQLDATPQPQLTGNTSATTGVQGAPGETPEPDREPAVVAAGPQEGYDAPEEAVEPDDVSVEPPTSELFDPETEPDPPVVAPPSVTHEDNPRTVSTAQIRLFHVKRKLAGLEEEEAKAIINAICGTPHIDRVPGGRSPEFQNLLNHLDEMAKGA